MNNLEKILLARLGPESNFSPEQKLLCGVLGRALADALGGRAKPHEARIARLWLQNWDAPKNRYPLTIQYVLREVIEDAEGCHAQILRILHDPNYDPTHLLSSYGYCNRQRIGKDGTCDVQVS